MTANFLSDFRLKQKINSEYPPLLLDVREEKELHDELGHIQGIVNIPIWKLPKNISELEKDKNNEIVAICRSGARAHTAAQILTKAGFTKVSVLNGGMISWNRN